MIRSIASAIVASLVFAGCSKEPVAAPTPPTQPPVVKADDPHGSHGHEHHDLGALSLGGFDIKVMQDGAIQPGASANFALTVSGTGTPDAVRLWIGDEQATDSVKAKAHSHGADLDAHVEVPATIAPGSALWVEVETAGGTTRASLPFK